MSPLRRHQLLLVSAAAVLGAIVLYVIIWPLKDLSYTNDFRLEAWPAYHALHHGHVTTFLRLAPPYVGSMILRAPFALVAMALGASWRGTYFASALPCLAAAPALVVWLRQRRGVVLHGRLQNWVLPLVLVLLNPLMIFSLALGHPEEITVACLAIAAVVLAGDGDSPGWAGLLVGLAAASKPWAFAVVPIVFAVMPAGRRRALLGCAVPAGLAYGPYLLALHAGGQVSASLGGGVGAIFHPISLDWWAGPAAWESVHAHTLIIVAGVVCAAAWWLLRARHETSPERRRTSALALLALGLLLRCALDPWNIIYYELPFLMAVMAIEIDRLPQLSLLYMVLLSIVTRPGGLFDTSANVSALAYAAVAVPAIVVLALRVYAPAQTWVRLRAYALGERQGRSAEPPLSKNLRPA